MNMEKSVRVIQTHHRTLLATLSEVVDEGILSPIAYIFTMGKGFGVDHRIEGEGIARLHPFAPVQALELTIQLIGITGTEGGNGKKDAQSSA